MHMPLDPAILLLGIYLTDIILQEYATLLTIAEDEEQPECPSVGDRLNKSQ